MATGDGIAMAYWVGAAISNMEFVQFHPTCLYHPYAKNLLISESLRGKERHTLWIKRVIASWKNIILKVAYPRDIVSRAIDDVLKRTGND